MTADGTTNKLFRVGQASTCNSQAGMVYDPKGLSMTICAGTHGYAMGYIVEKHCLKYQRNEYAKKIRKQYEKGEIQERRCNMREYTVRDDGCSNTLTTVLKDNYILEVKKRE